MSDFWEGFWMAVPHQWPNLFMLGWFVGGLVMVWVLAMVLICGIFLCFFVADVVRCLQLVCKRGEG
jgi:hypothetical protein